MEARAIAKHVRIAPRKIRIVADLVRGKNVSEAMEIGRASCRERVSPYV